MNSIDISKNTQLEEFTADNNNIENIDISNNSKLKKFTMTDNGLVRAYLKTEIILQLQNLISQIIQV